MNTIRSKGLDSRGGIHDFYAERLCGHSKSLILAHSADEITLAQTHLSVRIFEVTPPLFFREFKSMSDKIINLLLYRIYDTSQAPVPILLGWRHLALALA